MKMKLKMRGSDRESMVYTMRRYYEKQLVNVLRMLPLIMREIGIGVYDI